MKIKLYPMIVFLLFSILGTFKFHAQVYHEIGIMAGPVSLRSDYGVRGDSEALKNNIGFGFGINHYMNFAYTDFISQYPRQHFKVRSSLIYHTTHLNHFGAIADKDNLEGLQLRSMTGQANVLEIGSGIEYYLMRIRDYERSPRVFTPYGG